MGNREQTFNKILEVAYVMFAEKGFEKSSLAMIAAEVGISKPAIYYYFQSKDQLIAYLFEEICKEIKLEIAFDFKDITKSNLKAKLLEIGYSSIEEQKKDPYFNKIFNQYMLLASRDESYMKRLYDLQTSFLASFYELLKYAVQIKAIHNVNIEAKAHVLAMVYDNIGNFMLTGSTLNYKDVWKEAVENIIGEINDEE